MENNTSNTNNFLNWVEIKNFKSIKDLRLDCKRINVFIGKPNVGKSNILEGLGLLGAGYDSGKFLNGSVRYRKINDLFWDKNINLLIEVATNQLHLTLGQLPSLSFLRDGIPISQSPQEFSIFGGDKASRGLDELGNPNKVAIATDSEDRKQRFDEQFRLVKKYDFANLVNFISPFQDYLLPPNGSNLYEVIRRSKELWAEFARLFTEQKLELVLDDEKQEIILQKKDAPFVWQYPYFSIADTFRRFMFYITAIESNKNSVIVFEEPEVHSFPPYTQDIAYRMIYSEENQFFVSTHSPYLLQTLVSNLNDDQLNVFVTYYEDYQTKVKALTAEEISFVQEYSTDVFFNLDRFVPNVQSTNPA